MTKIKPKKYSRVTEMVRDLVDDADFATDFEAHAAEREISKKLFVLRNWLGMSQQEVADALKCTQSRISKLESGKDEDLRIGDLFAYLDALGMNATIVVHNKNRTAVDQVQFHALCIKRLCDHLAGLAADDAAIAQGVSKFFGEAAVNLIAMLHDSAKQLPLSQLEGTSPTIQTDLDDASLNEASTQERDSPRRKQRQAR